MMAPITDPRWMGRREGKRRKLEPEVTEEQRAATERANEAAQRVAEFMAMPDEPHGPWLPSRALLWRRTSIEDDVRRRGEAPVWAEKWAWLAGQPLFAQETNEHRSALNKRLWPLPLAIVWMAWQDNVQAARAWADFCFWGGLIWRNPIAPFQRHTLRAAEDNIWEALSAGRLRATAIEDHRRDDLQPEQWIDAKWLGEVSRSTVYLPDGREFTDVLVPSLDVRRSVINDASVTSGESSLSAGANSN